MQATGMVDDWWTPAPRVAPPPRALRGVLGALVAPSRGVALRVDAADGAAVDLALVAVAAVDAWCDGAGLTAPRPWVAQRLRAACRRTGERHHIRVTGGYHAAAGGSLRAMATAINAEPEGARAAVLCAVLLDLLNDRVEPEFRGVSEELARLDGECSRPAGYAVEAAGSRIADSVRRAYAGGV